ncbi:MAG: DoxX family protein [Rhodothermaceae bacterium]|nr:DoxX family protein [Rhodothermaceae bacterium]
MAHPTIKYLDYGLLLLRIGIGIFYIFHGYPKLFGGLDRWEAVGGAMGVLGIGFLPAFWGFMAAVAETFGGIFLILGLFTRPAAGLLFITMFVATIFHINNGDPFSTIAHSGKMVVLFLSLIIIGPDRFSLDNKINRRRR